MLAHAQTQRRQAEAQSEYERRFHLTAENMTLAAVAFDHKGIFTFCNNYFLELTGWQQNQVVGQNWLQHFIPKTERPEMQQILAHMDEPSLFPARYECSVLTQAGEERLIAWNNTLSYDAQGHACDILGISRPRLRRMIKQYGLIEPVNSRDSEEGDVAELCEKDTKEGRHYA